MTGSSSAGGAAAQSSTACTRMQQVMRGWQGSHTVLTSAARRLSGSCKHNSTRLQNQAACVAAVCLLLWFAFTPHIMEILHAGGVL
jgi:hypothetical protein